MPDRVLIGGVLHAPHGSHRRACLLPYLHHLRALELPQGVEALYGFVLDDCPLDTPVEILRTLQRPAVMLTHHSVNPRDHMAEDRAERRKLGRGFRDMAWIRNLLMMLAIKAQAGLLFSVDGDIMVPPDAFTALYLTFVRQAALLIPNTADPDGQIHNVMNFTADLLTSFHVEPTRPWGQANIVGAACLYREPLISQVSFTPDRQGEDVGFSRMAIQKQLNVWATYIAHPGVDHLFGHGDLARHVNDCRQCAPLRSETPLAEVVSLDQAREQRAPGVSPHAEDHDDGA